MSRARAWPPLGAPAWAPHGPALVGTAALLLAGLLLAGLVPRWQAERAAAEHTLQRMARASDRPAPLPAAPSADQRLLRALPPADLGPQRIAALLALAQQHAITLDSVRQGPPQAIGSGPAALAIQRLPLSLAARGSYAALRRFVADALQQDDALLLDHLRLGRSQPGAQALSAELRWSWLQQAATGTVVDAEDRPGPR
ncbi:MAG: hypothetical protein A3E25_16600 [Burkholderiales bacterium RIFCSPHIGHO2_12_FULL_69_20]|nr:MAG: hypothetical protein A3E25_16600 [Burkholderiales bacterium RIFCSPHIGHO2_12_FULL_69_20]